MDRQILSMNQNTLSYNLSAIPKNDKRGVMVIESCKHR